MLKQPIYALLTPPVESLRKAIISGTVTATIRNEHRDYKPGLYVLYDHQNSWVVMADVTDVRHCGLLQVTEEECLAAGYKGFEEFLEGLRKCYPNIHPDTQLTVFKWRNVRGKLINDTLAQNAQKLISILQGLK